MKSFWLDVGAAPSGSGAAGCQEHVSMLRVEDASALVGATARTVYRWIEAGKLHFEESDKGLVLVCTKSLAAQASPFCRENNEDAHS